MLRETIWFWAFEDSPRRWWFHLVRGVAAILFAVLAVLWPIAMLIALVAVMAALALLFGVLELLRAFQLRPRRRRIPVRPA